jgi:putative transposase
MKRPSSEQIICFLREANALLSVKELFRKHGHSRPRHSACKTEYGGMNVPEPERPRVVEHQAQEVAGEYDATRAVLKGKWWPWWPSVATFNSRFHGEWPVAALVR